MDRNAAPWQIRSQQVLKRGLDVAGAVAALGVLWPLLAIICVAIKIESPRDPLFFNDWVMGRSGTRFKMLKFRTMVPHDINYENRPEVHAGSPLVTRVGAILRRFKLDELPQFVNVLRGDMSFVGPRPMDPVRYETATAFQRQRLLVRPGLTGWSQVNGNIHWTWAERMQMDIWYLNQWSLALDFTILLAKIPSIVFGERRGARAAARITDDDYRIPWPGYGRFRSGRLLHAVENE